MIRRRRSRTCLFAMALALVLAAGDRAAEAGIAAAVLPATLTVSPGATFDLDVVVSEAGSSFNAFDAIVGHDPAALTLVEMSPLSLQEGALMTAACGSRFHRFRRGADRDTATVVLLCSGTSVVGPGPIYRLRFQASSTPQTTIVQLLPGTRFFDAGINVAGVTTTESTITIGAGVDVAPGDEVLGARLSAMPNPFSGATRLAIDVPLAGAQGLEVFDTRGRLVRRLAGDLAAGRHDIAWDGRTDAGVVAPSGLYFVRLRGPSTTVVTRLVRSLSR